MNYLYRSMPVKRKQKQLLWITFALLIVQRGEKHRRSLQVHKNATPAFQLSKFYPLVVNIE